MIQRPQSLFFLLSAILSTVIIHHTPIYTLAPTNFHVPGHTHSLEDFERCFLNHYFYANLSIIFSAAISIFAIFQFKNRSRQRILSWVARFFILICVLLLLFFYRNEMPHPAIRLEISYGFLCLFISWISLILAAFFIRKDEKLISSSDRIR